MLQFNKLQSTRTISVYYFFSKLIAASMQLTCFEFTNYCNYIACKNCLDAIFKRYQATIYLV